MFINGDNFSNFSRFQPFKRRCIYYSNRNLSFFKIRKIQIPPYIFFIKCKDGGFTPYYTLTSLTDK